MAMRYFKAHTTPFPVDIDFVEVTNFGLEMSAEIGWTRRPYGADPATAVTAHVEYQDVAKTSAPTIVTVAATVGGIRIDEMPLTDHWVRVRLENSRGSSPFSPIVEIPAP
jgi:hypothetical protein